MDWFHRKPTPTQSSIFNRLPHRILHSHRIIYASFHPSLDSSNKNHFLSSITSCEWISQIEHRDELMFRFSIILFYRWDHFWMNNDEWINSTRSGWSSSIVRSIYVDSCFSSLNVSIVKVIIHDVMVIQFVAFVMHLSIHMKSIIPKKPILVKMYE